MTDETASDLPEDFAERRAQFEATVARELGWVPAPEIASPIATPPLELGRFEVLVTDQPPKGYKRPDLLIVDDVARQLADDTELEAGDIEVACANGAVTLIGTVPSRAAIARADGIVASIFGVMDADLTGLKVERTFDEPDKASLQALAEGTSYAGAFDEPKPKARAGRAAKAGVENGN